MVSLYLTRSAIRVRFRAAILATLAICASGHPSLAQTADMSRDGLTPRDRVVLSLIVSTDGSFTSPSRVADKGEADIAPSLVSDVVADESSAISTSINDIALPVVSLPEPVESLTFEPKSGQYGFFQTASDYLTARGGGTSPQLKLRYKVVKADGTTAIESPAEMVSVLIGPDYAATVRGDGPLQIIDFKTHRLLTLHADAPEHFTNVSLYAARYKNIDTVRRMTRGGTLRHLEIGPNPKRKGLSLPTANKPKGLNTFYLESSLGFAASALPQGSLTLKADRTTKTGTFDGKTVFTGKFNGPRFDTPTQGYSLVSWLYHSLPIHPQVLATLTDIKSAPTYLKLYVETPNTPSGQIESWTLTDVVADEVPFPLPDSALSVTDMETVSPLAFVITEALHGRALGGPPDPNATLAAMGERLDLGDVLAVWLSARAMADRMGGCAALDGLCDMLQRARSLASDDPDVTDLVKAFDGVKNAATRTAALMTLQEAVADPDAPGVVLRVTALGLAKLKRNQIVTAGLTDLDAETLLNQAIAKDPYDYVAYQGLSQIYAAKGDFIESWDMSDALRAFSDAPQSMTEPFERAEGKLISGAPGFFPPIQR